MDILINRQIMDIYKKNIDMIWLYNHALWIFTTTRLSADHNKCMYPNGAPYYIARWHRIYPSATYQTTLSAELVGHIHMVDQSLEQSLWIDPLCDSQRESSFHMHVYVIYDT